MTREDALTSHGWQRRATTDDPRLSEMVELYRELGLEVRLEPFDPKQEAGCVECMAASPNPCQTIYTRQPSHRNDE